MKLTKYVCVCFFSKSQTQNVDNSQYRAKKPERKIDEIVSLRNYWVDAIMVASKNNRCLEKKSTNEFNRWLSYLIFCTQIYGSAYKLWACDTPNFIWQLSILITMICVWLLLDIWRCITIVLLKSAYITSLININLSP